MSESINELVGALAAAQGDFRPVVKSAENPHLRNRYATLDGVIDVIRGPLAKNGLAFVQPLTSHEGGWFLETRIMHKSGQWIACAARVPELEGNRGINSLQSFGASLTYMRRYLLTSLLGINTEEDTDGNGTDKTQAAPAPVSTHWIKDEKVRRRFWAWVHNDLGLTDAEAHAALNVAHVEEFAGTMGDAKTTIEMWLTNRDEPPEVPA